MWQEPSDQSYWTTEKGDLDLMVKGDLDYGKS